MWCQIVGIYIGNNYLILIIIKYILMWCWNLFYSKIEYKTISLKRHILGVKDSDYNNLAI